eukprot:scaffold233907_cov36-Tisochrysis_lutea.AAC.3
MGEGETLLALNEAHILKDRASCGLGESVTDLPFRDSVCADPPSKDPPTEAIGPRCLVVEGPRSGEDA